MLDMYTLVCTYLYSVLQWSRYILVATYKPILSRGNQNMQSNEKDQSIGLKWV